MLWKTWLLLVMLRLAFAMKLLVALFYTRLLGENIIWLSLCFYLDWLLAKYILIDSLWRLDSAPVFSLLIDVISFYSFEFSSFSAFLDSRSVKITAYLLSSCCCRRVADRFILVILLCRKAYFLISTVFSSSIYRRFMSNILLLCSSSLSSSYIFALS